MALIMPVLPLIGGGLTKFQPVYVDDVADAALAALEQGGASGVTYELGGPSVYTFRQLLELMLAEIRRKRLLVPVPFCLASLEAAVLELLPRSEEHTSELQSLMRISNAV